MRKPMLWYPKAKTIDGITFRARGDFEQGYPMGAVVHFTAGWRSKIPLNSPLADLEKECAKKAKQSLEGCAKDGYLFLLIDALGNVYQQFPLNKWGYHAGTSFWKDLGHSVSSKLVGIEIQCGGRVTPLKDGNYETWFKQVIPKEQVRYSKDRDNIQEGYYEIYTEAQEKSLTELLLWLEANGCGTFKFDYVLGHDEVAPKRKNDPGAALSMTMPEFRKHLITLATPVPIEKPKPEIPVISEPIPVVEPIEKPKQDTVTEPTPTPAPSEPIKVPEVEEQKQNVKESFWKKIISWFTKK